MPVPANAENLLRLMLLNAVHKDRRKYVEETPEIKLEDFCSKYLTQPHHEKYRKELLAETHRQQKQINDTLKWLEDDDHHLIRLWDATYPPMLRRTNAGPIAMFVDGDPALLWKPAIAVIGSRNPTISGVENTEQFVAELVNEGLVIVSGLAHGIDSTAHRQALRCQGETIAVIGTGPNVAYPVNHTALQREIAQTGAVVSEYLTGTYPARNHFPQRNRIIAGLSVATLVMESAAGSGAMITAEAAIGVNRDVFTVPGSIHNPLYRGNNQLIRDGATLVQNAQDVFTELHFLLDAVRNDMIGAPEPLIHRFREWRYVPPLEIEVPSPDYNTLWAAMDDTPRDMGLLVERTGLTFPQVSVILMSLMAEKLVVSKNGRYRHAERSTALPGAG